MSGSRHKKSSFEGLKLAARPFGRQSSESLLSLSAKHLAVVLLKHDLGTGRRRHDFTSLCGRSAPLWVHKPTRRSYDTHFKFNLEITRSIELEQLRDNRLIRVGPFRNQLARLSRLAVNSPHFCEPSTVWASSHALFLKSHRSDVAICRCSFRSGPGGIERENLSIWRRNSTSSATL
jgi:hypothetical protein